jgi:hypothetical protein
MSQPLVNTTSETACRRWNRLAAELHHPSFGEELFL